MIDRSAMAGLIRRFTHGRPVPADAQRAFEAHCDDLMGRASPWLLTFFLAVVVLWWPTDPLIYAGQPDAQRVMGLIRGLLVVMHLFWLTVGRRALRAHPARYGVLLSVGEAWMVGALGGQAGSFESPWPYFLFIWPLVSVCLARPFWHRLVGSLALGLGSLTVFALSAGVPLTHPYLPPAFSYMLFCCVFCALVGHATWILLRETFIQKRLIESQRRRLDNHRRELEGTVAEQTRDLQMLSQRLEFLREEERGWMARELHDALGQELTGARYAIDLVRMRLAGASARVDGALADIHRRLGLAHESVRGILRRLRPRILDELGLAAAVSWLSEDTAARSGLAIEFGAAPPDARLPPPLETALYRVTQEALSNVLHHAAAERVQVALEVLGGRCTLTVQDDGVGFEANGAATSSGAGCIGIRERIQALGGRAGWSSPPTGGTVLRVELPLEGA